MNLGRFPICPIIPQDIQELVLGRFMGHRFGATTTLTPAPGASTAIFRQRSATLLTPAAKFSQPMAWRMLLKG